jgi:hypothetical protein
MKGAPSSFLGVPPEDGLERAAGLLLYFSIITLSTTGFGDITPVSAVAHSLASLEAVIGQLYIVTCLGRLITLNTTPAPHDGGPGDGAA